MNSNNSGSTTRAMFLTAGAVGVALAATACESGATGTAAVADLSGIEAILRKPARHKQVIAAPKINGGATLRYAGNSLNAFQTSFHEGAGSLHVAAIFYGTALLFVANDALWSKYQLFDVLDRSGDSLPSIVHTPQNPFLHSHVSPEGEDFSVETLTGRGVSWVVCNNALGGLTRGIASMHGVDPASVYREFIANFVPGTTIVPSGVATVVLAQEAGFALLPA